MKVLCCGDREWRDYATIERELRALEAGAVVVHGACRGADLIAADVADQFGFKVLSYPAKWAEHGRAAGPIRNRFMLKDNPDVALVLAFHNNIAQSKGTADMVAVAKAAGIPVRVIRTVQE